jgi:hypothetical protein
MSPKELQLLGYFRELEPVVQGLVLENVKDAVSAQVRHREELHSTVRTDYKLPPAQG